MGPRGVHSIVGVSSVRAAHFENMKEGGKEIMVLEISALSDAVSLLLRV